MAFHKNLATDNIHQVYDQEYVDTTARDADTTWNGDATNVGKVVFVSTGPQVFMLLSTTPTWFEFSEPGAATDTIYASDGTVLGNRTVTGENDISLNFTFYDTNAATYTENYQIDITPQTAGIVMGLITGDGLGAATGIMSIQIDPSEMKITDSVNTRGLTYVADYSANFIDRSLPDKAYVDSLSLYVADGEVASNRVVTQNNGVTLQFQALSGTDLTTDYTELNLRSSFADLRSYNDTGVGGSVFNVAKIAAESTQLLLIVDGQADGADYPMTIQGINNAPLALDFLDDTGLANATLSAFIRSDSTQQMEIGKRDLSAGIELSKTSLLTTTLGMEMTDTSTSRGLYYADDYSTLGITAHGDRWIPDKGYTDGYADSVAWSQANQVVSADRTFEVDNNNRLKLLANDLTTSTFNRRSGLLLDPSVLAQTAELFYEVGDGAGGITSLQALRIGSVTGMLVTDTTNNIGLQYASDFSSAGSALGDRWVPDKGYNDSTYRLTPGSDNVIVVNQTSDLGTPSGGWYTFSSNTTLIIENNIDTGTNGISFEGGIGILLSYGSTVGLTSSNTTATVRWNGALAVGGLVQNTSIGNTGGGDAVLLNAANLNIGMTSSALSGFLRLTAYTNLSFFQSSLVVGGMVVEDSDGIIFIDTPFMVPVGNDAIRFETGSTGTDARVMGGTINVPSGFDVFSVDDPNQLSGTLTIKDMDFPGAGVIFHVHPVSGTQFDLSADFTAGALRAVTLDSAENMIVLDTSSRDILTYNGISNSLNTRTATTGVGGSWSGAVLIGNSLWIVSFDDTIREVDYTLGTQISSFTLPVGAQGSGIDFDGTHLIIGDAGNDLIYVMDGISSTVLRQFAAPSTAVAGIAFDGLNLITTDNDSDLIYVHQGVTDEIQYTMDTADVMFNNVFVRGAQWVPSDGTMLFASGTTDTVYQTVAPLTFDQSSTYVNVENTDGVPDSAKRGGAKYDDENGVTLTMALDTYRTIDGTDVEWQTYSESEKIYLANKLSGNLIVRSGFDQPQTVSGYALITRTAGGATDIKYEIAVHVDGEPLADSATIGILQANNTFATITTPPVTRQLENVSNVQLRIRNITNTQAVTVLHAKVAVS